MNTLPVWRKLTGYGIITVERCNFVRAARILAKEDCSLHELSRTDAAVTFAVSHRGMACLAKETERHPLPMQIAPGGRDAWIAKWKRHPVSLAAAVLTVCAVLSASCFYWRADLSGIPTDQREQVSAVIAREVGAFPVPRRCVDRRDLRDRILLAADGFSWAEVYSRGITLKFAAVKRIPAPELFRTEEAADIVSSRDAVIESIAVLSGTAHVSAGDAVRSGELLIEGIAGREGCERRVCADGIVIGRFALQKDVDCSMEMLCAPSGETAREIALVFGQREWVLRAPEGEFPTERETQRSIPLFPKTQLRITTHEALFVPEKDVLFLRAAQYAVGETAKELPASAQIADTDVIFSMTDDTVTVHCTLTCRMDIGSKQEVEPNE